MCGSCSKKKKKCNECARQKILSLIHSKSAKKTSKRIPTIFLAAGKGGVNVLGKYVR